MKRFTLLPFVALTSLALLTGCEIPTNMIEAPAQRNTCTETSECGEGAACSGGMCLSQSADLTGLLLEIRPNSGASFGASTSYIVDPSQVLELRMDDEGGVERGLDVELPPLVKISSGKVHFEYASTCAAPDKSFPAQFTFTRADTGFRGFPKAVYSVTSELSPGGQGYGFDLEVPPGTYDVYVQPQPIEGCADTLPPIVYPAEQIDGTTNLTWGFVKPTHLGGSIKIPKKAGFIDGWLLDIIEPQSGRVISTTQTLVHEGLTIELPIDLKYVWDDTKSSPYIRLRPPDGEPMPTVYWGLWESIINSSSSSPEVFLTVADLLITPRNVEIQVEDKSGHGVAASVEIQSIELSGAVASNASYGITIPTTNEKGTIKTMLPPGQYRIRVVPSFDERLAITVEDIEIPELDTEKDDQDECFCGRAIIVPEKTSLLGAVELPSREPLVDAQVTTSPSQLEVPSLWKRLHALAPTLPRPATTSSDVSGAFALSIDSGASDLVVQPPTGSGYPWLVRPRVTTPVGTQTFDLGVLTLANPALLAGQITDPNGNPIENVDVDAWLPVVDTGNDAQIASTVIRIATATTDANGHYELILPASISQ